MKVSFEQVLFTEKLKPEVLKCSVDEFIFKVTELAHKLEIIPDQLMAVIELETGGTFDPAITNSLGYTGLIQFGSTAAKEVGTTRDKLRKMNACEQLDYVYLYLKKYRGRMINLSNIYLAVFFPVAIGKPLNWTFETSTLKAEKVALWNPLFDINKDSKIQVWEVKKKLMQRIPDQYKHIV